MTTVVSRPGAPRPVTPQTILASRLDQLADQLEAAEGVDPALKSGLREACELARGLDPYVSRWTTPESAAPSPLARRPAAAAWCLAHCCSQLPAARSRPQQR